MRIQAETNNSVTCAPNFDLPPGWRWVRLGEVCEIYSNHVQPNTELARDLPYIGLENIESGTGEIVEKRNDPNGKLVQSITFRFDTSHVLYGKLRPYLNKVTIPDFEGRCTTELLPLLPKEGCERYYLAWLLRRAETVEEAMRHKTGSRMPRADMNELFKMLVPLPPIQEQKRIAAKLQELMQEIDRARIAIEKQLESAKTLPSAYLREVFESEEAKKWEKKRLVEVCEFQKGRKPRTLYEQQKKDCLPYILIKSFGGTYKQFTDDDSCPKCSKEDVLLVWDGARSGLCAIDVEGYIGSTISALRAKQDISSYYLYWFISFHYEDLNRNVRGTGIPHLEKEYVHSLPIPLPPLSVQHHIATELKEKMAQVENLQSKIYNQQSALDVLPQTILRKAFRGEL